MIIKTNKINKKMIESSLKTEKELNIKLTCSDTYSFQVSEFEDYRKIYFYAVGEKLHIDNVFFPQTICILTDKNTKEILIKESKIGHLVVETKYANSMSDIAITIKDSIIGDVTILNDKTKVFFENTIILNKEKSSLKNVEKFKKSKVFLDESFEVIKKFKDQKDLKSVIEKSLIEMDKTFFLETLNNSKKKKTKKLKAFRFGWLSIDFEFLGDEFVELQTRNKDTCYMIPKKFKVTNIKEKDDYFDKINVKNYTHYQEVKKIIKNFDGVFELWKEYEFNLIKMFFEQKDLISYNFMFKTD